jgi:dihydrofolate synthase/folylpolyglutamate synthase
MHFAHLSDWLSWQETLHPNAIDLGLERVRAVLQRLQWQTPTCPVITIAGTKGKGSCAALLDSMLGAAGYRVGLFTSPHLHRYNERIHIGGQEISDESLCVAFERINTARGEISLTYFEFNTLAALLCFASAAVDVMVLEVGMGGRLDAVNVIDADVAIVTSIGLDHTEWLGQDVASIGREKAGVFRKDRPALFGGKEMPASVQTVATEVGAQLLLAQRDFGFTEQQHGWRWWMQTRQLEQLPLPSIGGEIQVWNASVALAALHLLSARLPVSRAAIEQGLRATQLSGRFQIVAATATRPSEWILDVAHNPLSATVLADHLAAYSNRTGRKRTIAVLGVLADKDLHGMIDALRNQVDAWIAVGLSGPRALSAQLLAERLRMEGVTVLGTAADVHSACELAGQEAGAGNRVLVCGSFMSVGPALEWLSVHI